VSPAAIEKFGIGFAPKGRTVSSCGVPPDQLEAAGLLMQGSREDGRALARPLPWADHDSDPRRRGRMVGFAGRILGDGEPKYLNNPDSPHFDKGRILFNLHRATPAARSARRLIIVEGQFDTIALDQVGIAEVGRARRNRADRAPARARLARGALPDPAVRRRRAGRKAAMRACERALSMVGPGKALKVALLPAGEDPDSLARSGGAEAIEAAIGGAVPMADWLWSVAEHRGRPDEPRRPRGAVGPPAAHGGDGEGR
jgi:DNA primase